MPRIERPPAIDLDKSHPILRPLEKGLRWGEKRQSNHARKFAKYIVSLEEHFDWMSDKELKDQAAEFRERLQKGYETLDDIAPEAFAVVREVTKRVLGMQQYEEQIMAGLALYNGSVAEMKTGEGKTLAAILAAYTQALSGEPVHIATANDYLSYRDTELLRPVYEALGLSVGVVLPDNPEDSDNRHTPEEHRRAYECDVTYGTITEFGLDYLRDNMVLDPADRVQRKHGFLIVDEADAVLIDEARTPLIVENPIGDPVKVTRTKKYKVQFNDTETPLVVEDSEGEMVEISSDNSTTKWYQEFARLVDRMDWGIGGDDIDTNDSEIQELVHYVINEKRRTVEPTEKGIRFVEDQLGIDDLYDGNNSFLVSFFTTAMKAKALYKRDKDYIVDEDADQVRIVSEHTGRVMYGRRYHEGIHQALEAKEGITIRPDTETLAEISIQNYVKLYAKMAGMTGTAESDAIEFKKLYKMDVAKIPTRLPLKRVKHEPLIYKTEKAKFDAITDDILERYQTGQPILVGTSSVTKSEELSKLLTARNIPHKVLNAKNHAEEAAIIAEGGRRGSIIIATNMAGRGVDIKLGGDPEYLAEDALAQKYLTPDEFAEAGLAKKKFLLKKAYAAEYKALVAQYKKDTDVEAQVVKAAGGLYVIGTEMQDSKRIDDQLWGRAGRQGDPGETRLYLSFEDAIVQKKKASTIAQFQLLFENIPDSYPITSKRVFKTFQAAQRAVEEQNFETRRDVVDYDNVLNVQRNLVYKKRNEILESTDIQKELDKVIVDVVNDVIKEQTLTESGELDLEGIWKTFEDIYPLPFSPQVTRREAKAMGVRLTADRVREKLTESLFRSYEVKIKEIVEATDERYYEYYPRQVLMAVLELQWKEHLKNMDILQGSVQLRQYASRDPKIEYKREGLEEFAKMEAAFKRGVVKQLLISRIGPSQP